MGSEKTRTREKILEQLLDKFNLLWLNEKEETFYKSYDGCKSTIDLILANIKVAPEINCSKECDLLIIIFINKIT